MSVVMGQTPCLSGWGLSGQDRTARLSFLSTISFNAQVKIQFRAKIEIKLRELICHIDAAADWHF
jgi:hypothetical protein